MIKRKWARVSISLMISGLILALILPTFVSEDSSLLLGVAVFICLALTIAGAIIKLVFCKCPNCGSLAASNFMTWSAGEKVFYCPRCGKRLTYDDEDKREKDDNN